MKTILARLIFQKNATNAAEYACALGEKFHSRIILYQVTDSVEEAMAIIKEKSISKYGLKPYQKLAPLKFLRERNHLRKKHSAGG